MSHGKVDSSNLNNVLEQSQKYASGLVCKYLEMLSADEFSALTPILPDRSNLSAVLSLRKFHREGNI